MSVDNKAKGPYTDLQVRDKMKTGEFKPETLSYKEGEADWLPLEKQDVWTPSFVPKHPVETKDSKEWILLVESPLKKGDFEQQGPLSDDEVRGKIDLGEVHLKDFCWKPGMETWKPLFETYELGLPRKDKISFVEDKVEVERVSERTSEAPKAKFTSQMPDFIMPDEALPIDGESLFVESYKERARQVSTKLLPPLKKMQEPKEIIMYLGLVAVLFLGSFYIGYQNNQTILKGVQSLGQNLVSFSRSILPAAPSVSYVFLRELPLSKGSLLIKTDASQDVSMRAQVLTSSGALVRTLKGGKSLMLKTNRNGEAFLNLGKFKLKKGETYLVTTQVGNLKAKKTYTY